MLLHETGHLFGLPDLYLFNSTDWLKPVGAWDIMCDLDLGQHFLGWHKYKLGWLDELQLFYLKSSEVSLPLNPFESAEGVKVLLLPSESEARLCVVEIAQPLGANQQYRDTGILVYTVDAAVEAGKRPEHDAKGPGDRVILGRLDLLFSNRRRMPRQNAQGRARDTQCTRGQHSKDHREQFAL